MEFTTFSNNNSLRVQAAHDACFWFSLCDRERSMPAGNRKNECAIAAINHAAAAIEKYGSLWDELVQKLSDRYPVGSHDFSEGYAKQCVWLAKA